MSATTQAPAAYADAPITEGLPVYTLDNKRLGSVADVGDAYFRVHVRLLVLGLLARTNQVVYVDDRSVGMLFRALMKPNSTGCRNRPKRTRSAASSGRQCRATAPATPPGGAAHSCRPLR